MHFLISKKARTIIGWTPKCGCTHIKHLYYYLENGAVLDHTKLHTLGNHKLPGRYRYYKIILITRNPFKRLISGFLDKYAPGRGFYGQLPEGDSLTFTNFVDKLMDLTPTTHSVNYHHFIHQSGVEFNDIILKHHNLVVMDLENIDYSLLGACWGKVIPNEIINYRGPHERCKIPLNEVVFDEGTIPNLPIKDYYQSKVSMDLFYNESIKQKVINFYKKDFELFYPNLII